MARSRPHHAAEPAESAQTQSTGSGLLLSIRPRQWSKNLLLFAGLLFAKRLFDPPSVIAATGAFAIFASAFLSVLLIQSGWLVSRSALSGLVHLLILAAVFPVLDRIPSRRSPAFGIASRAG